MSETPEYNTTIEPVYVDLTADIVSAYVSNNTVAASDLPGLIASVHSALTSTVQGHQEPKVEELVPAVPVKKSVLGD
ncbi:MAG: MucR family transcriptional regulator, partial [Pseudomonadales bacterium]